jgi:defect-in-organelle-trafficking protein DotC
MRSYFYSLLFVSAALISLPALAQDAQGVLSAGNQGAPATTVTPNPVAAMATDATKQAAAPAADGGAPDRASALDKAIASAKPTYTTEDSFDSPHIQRSVTNGDTATSSDPFDDMGLPPEPTYAKDATLPPDLDSMVNKRPSDVSPEEANAIKIRLRAIQQAGLSYGARGGLSRRTWEIRQQLDKNVSNLDKTFNFRYLLVSAPSGLLIEPPVVTESERNVLVSSDGQEAAVTDAMLRISREARIVTAGREWRTYLERDWGNVQPPPDVVLPKNDLEQNVWAKAVATGWEQGYEQADEIFQSDLDRMVRDYTGMVRYRWLLAHKMISAPFALHQDRGVTGGGTEMRIGDRALSITGQSMLQARPDGWQPVPR